MKIKYNKLFLSLSIVFFFTAVPLRSQTVITHRIGDLISAEEAIEYGLFSGVDSFEAAEFQSSPLKGYKYVLTYSFRGGEGIESSSFRFGEDVKRLINLSLFQQDSLNLQLESSRVLRIKLDLKSGSTLIARFQRWSGNKFELETDFGILEIEVDQIDEVKILEERHFKNGEYWGTDPNHTRLFFAPTARALKKGAGYFADYELVFPGIAFGITDKFSFGGGIFPFSSSDFFLGWLTPKYTIMETKDRAVAVGLLNIFISGDNDSENVGILYGTATFGESDGALTAGLGYGYVGSNLAEKPMLMIGGEKRIGKRTKLLTKNWLFPGADDPLFSAGFRWFGEKLAADFGLFRTADMDFIGIPWLDIVVNF